MNDITGDRATSCMAFVRSAAMQRRYRELMACGDVTDLDVDEDSRKRSQGRRGRPDTDRKEKIDRESMEAAEMLKLGHTVTDVAAHFGISRVPLIRRLQGRGLWKPWDK